MKFYEKLINFNSETIVYKEMFAADFFKVQFQTSCMLSGAVNKHGALYPHWPHDGAVNQQQTVCIRYKF